MSDLKPCPFCGGEAKGVRAAKSYHIYCAQCGADVMSSTLGSMTTCQVEKQRLRAISKWNSRPLEESRGTRIAELERDNLKMKMFISSVASAMENKNVALHHLSCRAKELLAKGGE